MRGIRSELWFLRWDFIEKVASNELSRLIGIIPVAGYLILFNDALVDKLSFRVMAGLDETASSPFFLSSVAKLRLAFFGSLLVILANLLFRLAAPRILVHSKSDIDFSNTVIGSYSVLEIHEIERDICSDGWQMRSPLVLTDRTGQLRLKQSIPRLQGIFERINLVKGHPDYIRALAREWWLGAVHTKRIFRIVTFFSCLTGYLMLSLPTIDIGQAVLRDLLP